MYELVVVMVMVVYCLPEHSLFLNLFHTFLFVCLLPVPVQSDRPAHKSLTESPSSRQKHEDMPASASAPFPTVVLVLPLFQSQSCGSVKLLSVADVSIAELSDCVPSPSPIGNVVQKEHVKVCINNGACELRGKGRHGFSSLPT